MAMGRSLRAAVNSPRSTRITSCPLEWLASTSAPKPSGTSNVALVPAVLPFVEDVLARCCAAEVGPEAQAALEQLDVDVVGLDGGHRSDDDEGLGCQVGVDRDPLRLHLVLDDDGRVHDLSVRRCGHGLTVSLWVRACSGHSQAGAGPHQVEAVVIDGEVELAGDLAQHAVEVAFDLGVEGEVGHVAAGRTDEVVVMFGEVLGQLVAGEVVVGDDAMDDGGLFEHGEVPVGARLREVVGELEHLGDGQWTIGGVEDVDQGTAATRVALAELAEPGVGDVVQIGGHHEHPIDRTENE